MESSKERGFYVEFRIMRDGAFHWLAGKGQVDGKILRGTFYDIEDRKQLEARLLAVNEMLEARVGELREEAHALEVLNRTGIAVGAELDLEKLVQIVTDAGVELSAAEFGAFFYNVIRPDGEAYTLYTLSGAPCEAFANFPMPRNTAVFEQVRAKPDGCDPFCACRYCLVFVAPPGCRQDRHETATRIRRANPPKARLLRRRDLARSATRCGQ
jgi:hypothetical protein